MRLEDSTSGFHTALFAVRIGNDHFTRIEDEDEVHEHAHTARILVCILRHHLYGHRLCTAYITTSILRTKDLSQHSIRCTYIRTNDRQYMSRSTR